MKVVYTARMSRAGGPAYQLASLSRVCAATGRPLLPGERIVSALVETSPDDLARLDFSEGAWDAGARPGRLIGFWRATVPAQGETRRALIDDGSLLDLFEQLAEDPDPARAGLRFVLALLLVRKRLLTCERSEGGVMHVRVKVRAGEAAPPAIQVADPGLDDAAIEGVVRQLEAVLSGSGGAEGNAPQRPEGPPPQGGTPA